MRANFRRGLARRQAAAARLGMYFVPTLDSGVREATRLVPGANIPPGQRGPWHVDRRWVRSARIVRLANPPLRKLLIGPCWLTRLMRYNAAGEPQHWMTDSVDEKIGLLPLVREARGDVLIHGLGLGLAVRAVLRLPDVMRVTVVELSPEVVQLVAPHACADPRVKVVLGDAHTWTPPPSYLPDVVWHDIWPTREDAITGAARLLERWRGRCGWQGFWADSG